MSIAHLKRAIFDTPKYSSREAVVVCGFGQQPHLLRHWLWRAGKQTSPFGPLLLEGVSSNGSGRTRLFSARALVRIAAVKRLTDLGISLEMAVILVDKCCAYGRALGSRSDCYMRNPRDNFCIGRIEDRHLVWSTNNYRRDGQGREFEREFLKLDAWVTIPLGELANEISNALGAPEA